MREACLSVFSMPASSRLKDIIRNGEWVLPYTLKTSYPICYNIKRSIPVSDYEDHIKWKDKSFVSSFSIKEALFQHIPNVDWYNEIWLKGYSINYGLYCWPACAGGHKTSEKLATKNLGGRMLCLLCNSDFESHHHLFFECSFSMLLIRNILPNGSLFLSQANIFQVLDFITNHDYFILRNLSALIVAIFVYMLWRERNSRLHGNPSGCPSIYS